MLLVSQILSDAKEIFGTCADETLYDRINDGIDMLANKGDWSPLVAYLDVVPAASGWVSLPSDVETPMAVLVNGHPSLSRGELYRFHLNGPGDFGCLSTCSGAHEHQTAAPVMVDLIEPAVVAATLSSVEDVGSELWVLGYDSDGEWVRTEVGGTVVDGYLVPTTFPNPTVPVDAPEFARITAVRKELTRGRIRLHTDDWTVSGTLGSLLGDYLPHETLPWYRRMKVGSGATSVRLFIRKKTWRVAYSTDFIPLHSRFALTMAFRAVKAYNDRDILLGNGFEANAARLLTERESVLTPPGPTPIQVIVAGGIYNPGMDDRIE